jgi:hypothetical protein
MENNSVSFPTTFLSYLFRNLAMKTSAIFLAVVAAGVLAIVSTPILASADPAPKEDPSCSDPKFEDRDSCPGKSEEAEGNDRDDECTARNRGQASEDCDDDVVNPPKDD